MGHNSNAKVTASSRSDGSRFLAWMSNTEAELAELKDLLASSTARLDEQHAQLMFGLGEVQTQVAALEKIHDTSDDPTNSRLDVLEARFQTLEQLVSLERFECT